MDLNRNELEAMRILWEEAGLKPAEIEARFGWPIDNGTLRSVLMQLVDKKQIARKKTGKAYTYSAKVSQSRVLKAMAQRMAALFAGGSAGDLIVQLVKTEKLSQHEIAALQDLVRDTDRASRKRKGQES